MFDNNELKCPLKDDVMLIRNKMLQAEAFVIASPVYVEDINGIMKNWIDRMAFNCHRPSFFGKHAFLIVTSGIGASNHSLKTMSLAFSTWAIQIADKMKLRLGALTSLDEIQNQYEQKIRKKTDKLLNFILRKKQTPSFYSLIAFNVQKIYWNKNDKYKNTYDYKYWEEQGWLRKESKYYSSKKINIFKRIIAETIGKIVAIFFV